MEQKLSIETEAAQVARAAARRIRDDFQVAHPHYAPPPWADIEAWEIWIEANIKLHGLDGPDGFKARQLRTQIPQHLLAPLRLRNPQVDL